MSWILVSLAACGFVAPDLPPEAGGGTPTVEPPTPIPEVEPPDPIDTTYVLPPRAPPLEACVTGRQFGIPLLSTSVPSELHLLDLRRIGDHFEVTGAPDGSTIEVLVGEVADACALQPDGACLWVVGHTELAITVGGAAVVFPDVSGGLALQARDPATGATSGPYWVAPPGAPALDRILPAGSYDGFGDLLARVWVDGGDHVTVTGALAMDKARASVWAPDGTLVIAEPADDYLPYYEAVIGQPGWLWIQFGTSGWYSGTVYAEIVLTPSMRTWYADHDEDGHGDPGAPLAAMVRPGGYSGDGTDCDDAEPTAYPEAGEICDDGVDSDCDGYDASCAALGEGWIPGAHPGVSGVSLALAVGDLDGDGKEDLALSGETSTQLVSVLRGDLCLAPLGDPRSFLQVRPMPDDDGDGADSLLVSGDPGVWLVRGVPAADHTLQAELAPGELDSLDRRFADLTGDGLAELIVIPAGPGVTAMQGYEAPFHTGDPPFVTWKGAGGSLTALADLDGDGLGEVGVSQSGEVWVGFGPFAGELALLDYATIVWRGSDSRIHRDDDVDGDGDADLVVGSATFLTEVAPTSALEYGTMDAGIGVGDIAILGGDAWFTGVVDGLHRLDGPLAGTRDAEDVVWVAESVERLEPRDLDRDGAVDLLVFDRGTASILFGTR